MNSIHFEDGEYFNQVVEEIEKHGVSKKPDWNTVMVDKEIDLTPKKSAELFLYEWEK